MVFFMFAAAPFFALLPRGATDYPISDYPADIRPFLGYPGSIEIRLFGIRQYPLSDLLSADPTIGENMGK